ncbi:hypothetical protein LCGC14_0449010 [marine sediment metagenome]|uniref:Uncharacterized protein n=1 Tax=marine sediment metagenome TaxID=412755 RepID=A0A0F9SIC6_9ZZZZ
MPFKISGVELVRRLRTKVPEYKTMAEHCTQHAKEIRKKVDEISGISGHGKMQIMPDPDEIWRTRAESCKARASDLMWLSDSITEDQVHEVTAEEMFSLGIIGVLSLGFESEDNNED